VQELEATCRRLETIQQQVSWPGGLTNHADAFGPLCRMLLALHVSLSLHCPAAHGKQSASSALDTLRCCTARLLKAPLHPLLGNALYQVRVMHLCQPRVVAHQLRIFLCWIGSHGAHCFLTAMLLGAV
jgi:hypothetical protein